MNYVTVLMPSSTSVTFNRPVVCGYVAECFDRKKVNRSNELFILTAGWFK